MGKSTTDQNVTAEEEFSSLEQLLNQTADDASACLKILKKELSEYDKRHSNDFSNTAASFMRTDMRTAKDTASDMKRVAHQINNTRNPSTPEVEAARSMMHVTTTAMDALKTTARNYDRQNGTATVTETIKNAVGMNDIGKDNKSGFVGTGDQTKGDKQKDVPVTVVTDDDSHGSLGENSDTVEAIVKTILKDNFNMNPLDHQINAAEKALSPSIIDTAKEKISDVKDKLMGDKSCPATEDRRTSEAVNP